VETPSTLIDAGEIADGGRDAGRRDAGGTNDAGAPDGGARDAGPRDAGPDGGVRDGGPRDGGARDGGPDGGLRDGGFRDGGPRDGGRDGGVMDATPPSGFVDTLIDDTFLQGTDLDLVDIDGDTDLDAVASFSGTETVRLYVNGGPGVVGDGSTWTSVDVAPLNSIVASGHAEGDFDGDTRLDIVAFGAYTVGAPFMSPSRIAWYAQPTVVNGAWTENVVLTTGIYGLSAIAVGDLSGDGLPDLIVGAEPTNDENGMATGDGIFWLRNQGGGVFTAPIIIDLGLSAVVQIRIADIDRDGVDDIVASGRGSNKITWYENPRTAGMTDDNPIFVAHDVVLVTEANGFDLGQLDADADLELVVGYDDGVGGAIAAYDPPLDPTMPWTASVIDATLGGPTQPLRVSIADFNGDGLMDVVATSNAAATMRVYTRLFGGGWFPQTVTSQLTGLLDVDTGDIDGDGLDDLSTVTRDLALTRDELSWWRTQP
jgi:hypothetical protein